MSPDHQQSATPRSSRIRAAWRGEAPLSWVFWGFNFGGGLLLVAVGMFAFLFLLPFAVHEEGQSVLASPVFRAFLAVWVSIYMTYVVASVVMVWRCSFNGSSRVLGYIARAAIVAWLVRLLFLLRSLLIG